MRCQALFSLRTITPNVPPPDIALSIIEAGNLANVGPMEAVAGAVAIQKLWQGRHGNRCFRLLRPCRCHSDCLGNLVHTESDIEDAIEQDAAIPYKFPDNLTLALGLLHATQGIMSKP